jgi:hypothetical protein
VVVAVLATQEMDHREARAEAELVALQPLGALQLRGKALLEELVLEQSSAVTLIAGAEGVGRVLLELPGQYLEVMVGQGFAPQ